MGLLFAPLATAATSGVDRADAGLASGLLNTARQVGGSLALADPRHRRDRREEPRRSTTASRASAYTSGYDRAFQISAAVTFVALVVSFALPRNTGRPPSLPPAPAAGRHTPDTGRTGLSHATIRELKGMPSAAGGRIRPTSPATAAIVMM